MKSKQIYVLLCLFGLGCDSENPGPAMVKGVSYLKGSVTEIDNTAGVGKYLMSYNWGVNFNVQMKSVGDQSLRLHDLNGKVMLVDLLGRCNPPVWVNIFGLVPATNLGGYGQVTGPLGSASGNTFWKPSGPNDAHQWIIPSNSDGSWYFSVRMTMPPAPPGWSHTPYWPILPGYSWDVLVVVRILGDMNQYVYEAYTWSLYPCDLPPAPTFYKPYVLSDYWFIQKFADRYGRPFNDVDWVKFSGQVPIQPELELSIDLCEQIEWIDSDNDGFPDFADNCPEDFYETEPGICGCGISDTDTDLDGTVDCMDECPLDNRSIVVPCLIWGDADGDEDLDMVDYAYLQRCYNSQEPECAWWDIDQDGLIADVERLEFFNCAGGPAMPTNCP